MVKTVATYRFGVQRESITIAVLPASAKEPTHVDKLLYDLRKIRRYVERVGIVAYCNGMEAAVECCCFSEPKTSAATLR